MASKVRVHVYFGMQKEKVLGKLGFRLAKKSAPLATKDSDEDWVALVSSCYGEFGVCSGSGFGFVLKPTAEALYSTTPILVGVLRKATKQKLRLIVEYNEGDARLRTAVDTWKQSVLKDHQQDISFL